MFDYVSRKDFDAERDARQRAESTADALRERITFLEDIVNRFIPKHEATAPAEASYEEMTPEQIMAVPATGRREIVMRQHRADEAMKRDERNRVKESHDKLTPEEKEAVSKTLAVGV